MTLRTNYNDGGAAATTGNVTAADMNAISSAVNAIPATGMLAPAQSLAIGTETFTISSGSITQIGGTTIQGAAASVGDRILVMVAPASTGAGSSEVRTTEPANGVYVVTGNTTNLTVTRSSDMSGTINPAGLSIYVEKGATWQGGNMFTVTTPSSSASFTYGTGTIEFTGTGGVQPSLNSFYANNTTESFGMWNGTGNTFVQPTANAGNQTLALPASGTPAATTLALWDANANLTANNLIPQLTSTATAAGTTTLTIASDGIQVFTGTNTQTVKLPTTSVTAGYQITIINNSTGTVTVESSAGTPLTLGLTGTVAAGKSAVFTALSATPTSGTSWWSH